MKRSSYLTSLLLALLVASVISVPQARAAELLLAHDKKAALPVAISANASEEIKATAADLADKLSRITGATFEVKAGDGSSGIVLGTLKEFPHPELVKPLEIRQPIKGVELYDGIEAFAIRTEPKRLLLIGNTPLGVSHAAARVLELIGYRRFYPAKEWEVVPSISSLKFEHNETDRPAILSRRMWYAFGYPKMPYTQATSKLPDRNAPWVLDEFRAWERANRLGLSFNVFATHIYGNILQQIVREHGDTHPEYFTQINGQRVKRSICLSQPVVRKMLVDYARDYLTKNPGAEMVSMEPSDGSVWCECELCSAKGSPSVRAFDMANETARMVQKEFPGKMVGILAYNFHDAPPPFAIEPNVHVQVARLFIRSEHSFEELLRMWSQKTKNLGVYDYFSTYQWGQDRIRETVTTGGPTASISFLQQTIPFQVDQGVLSLWSETSIAWGAHGRGNYIATKLMWNPQADVETLLKDFYDKAFGPAAVPMKKYYDRLDPGSREEIFGVHFLAMLHRDLQEASILAKNRPDVQARLDHLKQYLHYNTLVWKNNLAQTKEEKTAIGHQLLVHEYRTRYSYMTHWGARLNYLPQASWREVKAADEEGRTLPEPEWIGEKFYTPEETERNFQEGLALFQPQPVSRREYSDDVVAVTFAGTENPEAWHEHAKQKERYLVYSVKGEPLRFTLRPDKSKVEGETVNYTLLTKDGRQVVAEGKVLRNGEAQPVEIKVPGPGTYQLETYSWVWNISFPPGRPASLALDPSRRISQHKVGDRRMFFYIPKGIQDIHFYWGNGTYRVFDAEGKLAKEGSGTRDNISVLVPPGMDGRLWSIDMSEATLYFYNLPNYIAMTPNALLYRVKWPRRMV